MLNSFWQPFLNVSGCLPQSTFSSIVYSDQYWSISNWYLARRPFWSYLIQLPEATTPKSASVQLDDQWSSLYPVSQLAWATKTGQRKSFTFLYKYLISLEYHLQGYYNWTQFLETHLQVSERLYIVLATLIIEVSLHNSVSTSISSWVLQLGNAS